MDHSRRYATVAGLVVLVGAGLILATIVWRWGHLPYGIGVAVVVIGVVWAVTLMARGPVSRIALSAGAAVVLVAGAVVAVAGFPQSPPQWKIPTAAQRPNGESARTGDLIIIGGTARLAETGAVAWAHEGPDAKPLLVNDGLVVIGTKDGSIGVDPPTGREIWRSTVTGRGIAHDGKVLVVAARAGTEAMALDLTTGATLWRQSGRPVMECDLGPTPAQDIFLAGASFLAITSARTGGRWFVSEVELNPPPTRRQKGEGKSWSALRCVGGQPVVRGEALV